VVARTPVELSLCRPSNFLGLQTLPCRWRPYGRGWPMSKKQRLAEYSFRPALVVAMREAFQKACKAPQVADGAPEVTEAVARRILELAKAGETSPDRLCTGALRKLSH
jgi:hypothetical protein